MYHEARPMNPGLMWVATAVLGLAASLLVGSGGTIGFVFVILSLPLVLRRPRLVALSGFLAGFGGTWSLLMGFQLASGGRLENADLWLAVGIVPLIIGLALGAWLLARSEEP
jgi:hypothetical protein